MSGNVVYTVPSIVQCVLEQGVEYSSHYHNDEGVIKRLDIEVGARELPAYNPRAAINTNDTYLLNSKLKVSVNIRTSGWNLCGGISSSFDCPCFCTHRPQHMLTRLIKPP